MSEKKRKNRSAGVERPSKKQQTTANVIVRHLEGTSVKPVIGTAPGVSFPTNIRFKSYAKSLANGSSNLLLYSSEHPTIDYTANEGDNSLDTHLKHYVAAFDPSTGELTVTEAKKLNVRASIRTLHTGREEDGDDDSAVPVTNYSSRAALTEAFGTKKSRKAVQSVAENRLLAQGNEEADNPVSAAMMADMIDDGFLDSSQVEAASIANKPIPQPDLFTNEIAEVYSLRTLVAPSPEKVTLAAMPIHTWIKRISSKKEVMTRSRFVANRVGHLTKHLLNSPEASDPNLKQHLQVLRYIQVLLEIHNYVRTLPRKRSIPPANQWPDSTLSEGTPLALLTGILPRFFTGDKYPTTQAITLLRTTILALTLHIPPPSLEAGQGLLMTEPSDIALDMAIEASEIRKLYRELGCKIDSPTDTELSRWKLEKHKKQSKKSDDGTSGTAGKLVVAKLRLPLVFPKVSRGKPQR